MLKMTKNMVEFYENAAIIKKHLPAVVITNEHKIIYDEGRYYGLLLVDNGVGIYDHVIIDKTMNNPEFITNVLNFVFSNCVVCNCFIDVKNKASCRYTQGVGFEFMGYLPYADKTCAIYSMSIQKWLDNPIRKHYLERESN